MEPLDGSRILSERQRKRVIGRDGEVCERVSSTMEVCRERGLAGAPDGYVVLAEEQTAGRGREGGWECPPRAGVLMSVFLRRGVRRQERRLLPILGAVAAASTVQRFGPEALIKWPNDIVTVQSTEPLRLYKLGGVIAEQVPRSDAAPAHVLGIGLNVNQTADALPEKVQIPATSLRVERDGRSADRSELCGILLDSMDYWYQKLAHGHPEALLARWRSMSSLVGKRVRIMVGNRAFSAEVLGLRESGELIVEDVSGRRLHLSDGEASLLL